MATAKAPKNTAAKRTVLKKPLAKTPVKTAAVKARTNSTSSPDFDATFKALRAVLEPTAKKLIVKLDTDKDYYIIGPTIGKKEAYFGAVKRMKNYVSYYLMCVYAYPVLLEGISHELKKHMQGKSCFNFTQPDEKLFAELKKLTETGYKKYKPMMDHMAKGGTIDWKTGAFM